MLGQFGIEGKGERLVVCDDVELPTFYKMLEVFNGKVNGQ